MLVLTRELEQSVVFAGGLIEVKVVQLGPKRVRLGIVAPRDISVHRKEVLDRIRQKGHSHANDSSRRCAS
jgi:carbon storage regulator